MGGRWFGVLACALWVLEFCLLAGWVGGFVWFVVWWVLWWVLVGGLGGAFSWRAVVVWWLLFVNLLRFCLRLVSYCCCFCWYGLPGCFRFLGLMVWYGLFMVDAV